MLQEEPNEQVKAFFAEVNRRTLLERPGDTGELKGITLFLTSEASSSLPVRLTWLMVGLQPGELKISLPLLIRQ